MSLADVAAQIIKVLRVAGVITAGRPVRLIAASAKVQGDAAESTREQCLLHSSDIARPRRARQAVQEDDNRIRGFATPVEVHEIAIRRGQPLARGGGASR